MCENNNLMTMDIATPAYAFLKPSSTFGPDTLHTIEALEPGALMSLLSFKRDSVDLSDWNPEATLAAARQETFEVPSLPLPPKKRIRRKYIIQTESKSEPSSVPKVTVPSTLYAHGDEDHINPIHNILRRDILEVFVESPRQSNKKSHNGDCKAVKARQSRFAGRIGLRCRFCKHLPEGSRSKLATIYPETLEGIYRACSVRFQKRHLGDCQFIPDEIREQLDTQVKNSRGSKSYWVESALLKGFRNSAENKGIIFCPEIES